MTHPDVPRSTRRLPLVRYALPAVIAAVTVITPLTYGSWPDPWRTWAATAALTRLPHAPRPALIVAVGHTVPLALTDVTLARCALNARLPIVEYRRTLSDPDGPGRHPDDRPGRRDAWLHGWRLSITPPFPAGEQDWTPLPDQTRQVRMSTQLRRALTGAPCTAERLYVTPLSETELFTATML